MMRWIAALTFLVAGGAYAADTTMYLDPQAGRCSNYDRTTRTCGPGSSENFIIDTTNDIVDVGFAGDNANRAAGGRTILNIVGDTTLDDSVYMDLSAMHDATSDGSFFINFNGNANACNGDGTAPQIIIQADPAAPYFHWGAYQYMDPTVTAFEEAYRPEQDRPMNADGWGFVPNVSMVYRFPTPPDATRGARVTFFETDEDEKTAWSESTEERVVASYESKAGLKEWSDHFGVKWYAMRSADKTTRHPGTNRGTPPQKIWNFGDMYRGDDGFVYWLLSDGGDISQFRSGVDRAVGYFRNGANGINYTNCAARAQFKQIVFHRMGQPIKCTDSPGCIIEDPKFMRNNAPPYYAFVLGDHGTVEMGAGGMDSQAVFSGGYLWNNADVRNHRKDVMTINDAPYAMILDTVSITGSGHGITNWEATFGGVIHNNHWNFDHGKGAQTRSVYDMWVVGNKIFHWMIPFCPEPNTPSYASWAGTPGDCPSTAVWPDGDEAEDHPGLHITGSDVVLAHNWGTGNSGWLLVGGLWSNTANWRGIDANPDGATNIGVWHNFSYRQKTGETKLYESNKGPREGQQGKVYGGRGTAMVSQDDNMSKASLSATSSNIRWNANLCVDPEGRRYTDPSVSSCMKFVFNDTPLTPDGRGYTFDSNMWVATGLVEEGLTAMIDIDGSTKSCADFSDDTGVTGHICSTAPIKVASHQALGTTSQNLSIVETHAGVDQAPSAATIVGNPSATSTITISDMRDFLEIQNYGAHQGPYFAKSQDRLWCGEENCSDTDNPGRVPDSEYLAGGIPDGHAFVQIGSTKTSYTSLVSNGTGNQGTMTLAAPITSTNGTLVHPWPFCGSAPDVGPEFCGAAPSILVARDDAYTFEPGGTRSAAVLTNDQGFGDCAGAFQLKAAGISYTDPKITSAVVNGSNIDVTLASGEQDSVLLTYTIEGTGACAGTEDTATLDMKLRETTGTGSSDQAFVWLDAQCDIAPTALSTWQSRDLNALCGIPTDAKLAFIKIDGNSGTANTTGVREGDSSADESFSMGPNAHLSTFVALATGAVIDVYETQTSQNFHVRGYVPNTASVTVNNPPTDRALTCDSTTRVLPGTYAAGELVLLRSPPDEGRKDISFHNTVGGIATREDGFAGGIYLVPNGDDEIIYRCPPASFTALEEVAVVADTAVTVLTTWDINAAPSTSVYNFNPGVSCLGDDGCEAVVLIGDLDSNRRLGVGNSGNPADAGLDTAWYPESINEANDSIYADVMVQDTNGDLWGKFNSTTGAPQYLTVAGFNTGSISSSLPDIWELTSATCTGTTALNGMTPTTTSHGTNIIASGAACNGSGHVALTDTDFFAARVGASVHETTFIVTADGQYVIDYNHDGYGFADGAGINAKGGSGLYLDFDAEEANLFLQTPNRSVCGATYSMAGIFAASADVHLKIATSGTALNRTTEVYIEGSAIDATHPARLTCRDTGPNYADGMAFQVRKTGDSGTLKLPLTIQSSQAIDNTEPAAVTLTLSKVAKRIDASWPIPNDPGGNSASRVRRIDVYEDTSLIAELSGTTTSHTWTAATEGSVNVDVVFEDAAGNTRTVTDSVTTTTPNTAPVIGTPDAASVPVGMGVESPIVALDMVDLCNATDDDPMVVEAIITQPTNGTATLRANDREIDYQQDQGATAADSVVVTIRDDQGGVSSNCTVVINPQTPPYVQVEIQNPLANSDGITWQWTLPLKPKDEDWAKDEATGGVKYQSLTGATVSTAAAACDLTEGTPAEILGEDFTKVCGEFTVWIEVDMNGDPITDMPPLGSKLLIGLRGIENGYNAFDVVVLAQ